MAEIGASSADQSNGSAAVHNDYHGDIASSLISDETQTGVKGIEAISQAWTTRSLIVAYLG